MSFKKGETDAILKRSLHTVIILYCFPGLDSGLVKLLMILRKVWNMFQIFKIHKQNIVFSRLGNSFTYGLT